MKYCNKNDCQSLSVERGFYRHSFFIHGCEFSVSNALYCIDWINILYTKAQNPIPDNYFIGFNHIDYLYDDRKTVFGAILKKSDSLFIIFRGTLNVEDAIKDADTHQEYFLEYPKEIMVHRGILNIYQQIRPQLINQLEKHKNTGGILWTGHSLGAALAVLASFDMHSLFASYFPRQCIFLFACPRVGNPEFASRFDKMLGKCYRVVNTEDIINSMPLSITIRPFKYSDPFVYQHVGLSISFSDNRESYYLNHDLLTYETNIKRLGGVPVQSFSK